MKTPTSLYFRLALITSVTLVVGYFVVYAAYQTFTSPEYQSGAALSSTFLGKIVSNLDEINGRVTTLEGSIAGASVWSKVGSDINYTAGKVGIGTTTPVASLDVKRTAADSQFAGWIEGSDIANYGLGVNIANTTSAKAIADFKSGNTSRLFVRADGNVGIGTVNPYAKIHSLRQTFMMGSTTDLVWGSVGTVFQGEFGAASGNTYTKLESFIGGGSTYGNLILNAGGGNIGIGTTNPGRTLFVNGASGANGSVLVSNGFFEVDGSNSYAATGGGTANLRIGWPTTSRVGFNLQGTEVMSMLPGGNVGIGATAPAEKLEVNGMIRVTDGGNGSGRIRPKYVASVSTTPVIVGRVGFAGLFVVIGWDAGSNQFSDLVFYAYGNSPQVISSKTVAGAPTVRTYTASAYDFTLQMASGTYSISSVGMTN